MIGKVAALILTPVVAIFGISVCHNPAPPKSSSSSYSGSSGSSPTNAATMCGDNAQTIKNYLQKSGYDENAINGIMGNLYAESKYDPYVLQDGSPTGHDVEESYRAWDTNGTFHTNGLGFGIAQWTTYQRVENLQKYADSKGKKVVELTTQLEFLVIELDEYGFGASSLNGKTIEETTDIILRRFESPNDPDGKYPERLKFANEAALIGTSECPSSGSSDSSGSGGSLSNVARPDAGYTEADGYYNQFDNAFSRTAWRGSSCGVGSGANIPDSGCSMIAVANSMKFLGKTPNNPNDIAREITSGTPLVCGANQTGWDGSNMSIDLLLKRYNLNSTTLWVSTSTSTDSKITAVREALSNNQPVILRGYRASGVSCNANDIQNGKCVFSSGGHFVTVIGIAKDNKLLIANPARWIGNNRYYPAEEVLMRADRAARIY